MLESDDETVISPANAQRYQPYVDLLLEADTQGLVELYGRYYALFQEAYEAQGYPDGYFNDRLVEVIEHLLATPEPQGMLARRPERGDLSIREFPNSKPSLPARKSCFASAPRMPAS